MYNIKCITQCRFKKVRYDRCTSFGYGRHCILFKARTYDKVFIRPSRQFRPVLFHVVSLSRRLSSILLARARVPDVSNFLPEPRARDNSRSDLAITKDRSACQPNTTLLKVRSRVPLISTATVVAVSVWFRPPIISLAGLTSIIKRPTISCLASSGHQQWLFSWSWITGVLSGISDTRIVRGRRMEDVVGVRG